MSCQPHRVTSGQLNSGHKVRLIFVPKTGNIAQSNWQYLLYLKNDQASMATWKEWLENNMTRVVNPWNDCQLLSTELNQGTGLVQKVTTSGNNYFSWSFDKIRCTASTWLEERNATKQAQFTQKEIHKIKVTGRYAAHRIGLCKTTYCICPAKPNLSWHLSQYSEVNFNTRIAEENIKGKRTI